MALIPGMNYRVKERSANSRLIVSGVEQPAENFILDPDLPVLFKYSFGWPGMQEVVIPKGVAVAVKGRIKDWETGVKKPVLTIADGTRPCVGVAPYNICKKYDDQLVGNEPTFVRNVYIELPYISDPVNCALVKYGAVYGDGLQEGDYVTVSTDPMNKGHLTKWDESTGKATDIVGQVIAIEDDQEPWGWFKWVMWDEQARREDRVEPDWAQNAVPGENGYPYDKRYRDGILYQSNYLSEYTVNPSGIPGLTDGAYRGSVRVPFTIPSGSTEYTVDLPDLIPQGLVKVFVNNIEMPADSLTVDYENKNVTIKLPWAASVDLSGYVICQKEKAYGTPPGWDYVGLAGVARIILF